MQARSDVHELSVTEAMLDVALEHAQKAGVQKITGINLVIGQMCGIVNDCVRFYFDFVSKGTIAEGAVLSFERVASRLRCRGCGEEFVLEGNNWACPACGALGGEMIAGREFYMDSIEVE